ncbi:MAG TPA: hypothetical protein VFL85_03045 [Candidatus Saccharimonadales bacterium]|nr:hypothetical protein [Candidatus Saccharimonadales bacterium]
MKPEHESYDIPDLPELSRKSRDSGNQTNRTQDDMQIARYGHVAARGNRDIVTRRFGILNDPVLGLDPTAAKFTPADEDSAISTRQYHELIRTPKYKSDSENMRNWDKQNSPPSPPGHTKRLIETLFHKRPAQYRRTR